MQRLLIATGFLLLGYCGLVWMNSRLQQERGNQELDRILTYKPRGSTPTNVPKIVIPDGGLVGRVEVPKLHLSAVVFQGTTASVLDHGVGHLDGSPLPGQNGNVVLAAHRDTFFRSLRNIHEGDDVTVETQYGTRTYKVASTEIVPPTDVSVLDPTLRPALTLITCYPFYYVGHAPKRFIVRAFEIPPVRQKPEPEKQEARTLPPPPRPVKEQSPDPQTPEQIANLTYVFKASQ